MWIEIDDVCLFFFNLLSQGCTINTCAPESIQKVFLLCDNLISLILSEFRFEASLSELSNLHSQKVCLFMTSHLISSMKELLLISVASKSWGLSSRIFLLMSQFDNFCLTIFMESNITIFWHTSPIRYI